MKYSCRALFGSVILAVFALPASAQQKLTFDNVTPPIVVDLLTGQNLVVQTNGNINAKCVIDTQTSRCIGLGSGVSTTAPTVSLAATNFVPAADLTGKYSAGTTFTITPTVTNAEVCVRQSTGPSGTGWVGTVTAPFTPGSFTLPASNSSYSFQLKCYGDGGSAVAAAPIAVQTNEAPPEGNCNITPPPVAGYTRNDPPNDFTDLQSMNFTQCTNFPSTGSPLCKLLTTPTGYVSLKFTAPIGENYAARSREFYWEQLQIDGLAADEKRIYVSLSECQGDFRLPLTAVGPVGDPTLSIYCRNYRGVDLPGSIVNFSTSINYNVNGVAGGGTCGITPGKTYYFNFILADPSDLQISPGEGPQGCLNSQATQCGLQIRVH